MIRKKAVKEASKRIVPPFIIIGMIPIIVRLITKGYVGKDLWIGLSFLGIATIILIGVFAWLIGRNDKDDIE